MVREQRTLNNDTVIFWDLRILPLHIIKTVQEAADRSQPSFPSKQTMFTPNFLLIWLKIKTHE